MGNMNNIPKLRFPEFTEGWGKKKLGDIVELTSSKRVYLSDYVSEGIPFYRGKEITELKQNIQPKDILYITEKSYLHFKETYGVPKINDILMTAVGTLGNVLKIRDEKPFYFKDGNLIWFRNISVDCDFLEILLGFKNNDIEKSSIGSTQRALTMVELRKLVFQFPSLPEQTKIATFLTAVDNKLNQLKKKKTLLEQYKKGVMQKIFDQEIRFKDDDGNEFPEWEVKKLGEIGEFIGGGTPSTQNSDYWIGNIPWVSSSDLSEESIYKINATRFITHEAVSKSATKLVPKGSILIVSRVGVGKVAVNEVDLCTSQDFTNLILNTDNYKFLAYLIKYRTNKLLEFNQGTSIKGFVKSDLENLEVNLPTLAEQTKIANFLSAIDEKIEYCGDQIGKTEQYKKGMLQEMFV